MRSARKLLTQSSLYMAELRIVCDGCGSVYYVPEATACRVPCENCGLKLDCHGGEYRSPAKDGKPAIASRGSNECYPGGNR